MQGDPLRKWLILGSSLAVQRVKQPGCCCGLGSIPSPGTSFAVGTAKKTNKTDSAYESLKFLFLENRIMYNYPINLCYLENLSGKFIVSILSFP